MGQKLCLGAFFFFYLREHAGVHAGSALCAHSRDLKEGQQLESNDKTHSNYRHLQRGMELDLKDGRGSSKTVGGQIQ